MTKQAVAAKGAADAPPERVSRAGRPSKPLITRTAAAQTALAVIDRDGLDGLSLQSVARAMGVSAPSLYHHFKDKEELLAEVAKCLLAEIGHEQEHWSTDWETRMVELSVATRRVALRHPNAAPLSLRFFPRQVMLPAYESGLRDCPYPLEVHMIVHEVIEKLTYGSSLFAAAAESHHIPAMPEVDPGQFPRLAEAIALAPSDEEIFAESLKVALAGLRARYGS
jgi:TetR/AcrR family tetracycline transcriptional repressor